MISHSTAPHDRVAGTVTHTTCCIVGCGPAGAVLALLLARQGISVVLLEAHTTFDRPFRGNTINPSAMHTFDELGLLDDLLQLRHTKLRRFVMQTATGTLTFANFAHLRTRYPYIMMLPQHTFLAFITALLRQYPHAQIVLGASVHGLVREQGAVCGVRYRASDGWHEVRATLTVGADGRFSRVRKLAGLTPIATAPPIDVLWFNLPRDPEDAENIGALFRFVPRGLLVLMDHYDHWQVGYLIAKGSFPRLRAAGIDALRRSLVTWLPEFAARVEHFQDWKQCSLLSVESNRLRRWHQPGLLLIGDAAHVTSPIGGVGINLAIQDAVVAANVVSRPLKHGTLCEHDLRKVQRRRCWQICIIQSVQSFAQWQVMRAFADKRPFVLPAPIRLMLRVPLLRSLPAWLIAFGVWPVHVSGMKHEAGA